MIKLTGKSGVWTERGIGITKGRGWRAANIRLNKIEISMTIWGNEVGFEGINEQIRHHMVKIWVK